MSDDAQWRRTLARWMEPSRVLQFPAMELHVMHSGYTEQWLARWQALGGGIHQGRMVAMKTEAIWEQLDLPQDGVIAEEVHRDEIGVEGGHMTVIQLGPDHPISRMRAQSEETLQRRLKRISETGKPYPLPIKPDTDRV